MSKHTPGPWKADFGGFTDDGRPMYELIGPTELNALDARRSR
jgi:hypothetical protein